MPIFHRTLTGVEPINATNLNRPLDFDKEVPQDRRMIPNDSGMVEYYDKDGIHKVIQNFNAKTISKFEEVKDRTLC